MFYRDKLISFHSHNTPGGRTLYLPFTESCPRWHHSAGWAKVSLSQRGLAPLQCSLSQGAKQAFSSRLFLMVKWSINPCGREKYRESPVSYFLNEALPNSFFLLQGQVTAPFRCPYQPSSPAGCVKESLPYNPEATQCCISSTYQLSKLRDIFSLFGPQLLHQKNGATVVIVISIVIEIINFCDVFVKSKLDKREYILMWY